MTWQRDGKKDPKKRGALASASTGAARNVAFTHKERQKPVSRYLEQGSLLLVKGTTQDHWLHRLPPARKLLDPRIST